MSSPPRKVLLSWSSGKDSAWALHVLRGDPALEVVALVTTMNEAFSRVAMHGVRRTLLERQARAAALPLWQIPLPHPCPNEIYEQRMRNVIAQARAQGIEAMAFGDLFLEDIRAYREQQLAGTGLEALFPLWGRPTHDLAQQMLAAGVRAQITCVDLAQLPSDFAGRVWDEALLEELPPAVDPCGEHGEFHTFAFAGPMFRGPIEIRVGRRVEREGFMFADLVPGRSAAIMSKVRPAAPHGSAPTASWPRPRWPSDPPD